MGLPSMGLTRIRIRTLLKLDWWHREKTAAKCEGLVDPLQAQHPAANASRINPQNSTQTMQSDQNPEGQRDNGHASEQQLFVDTNSMDLGAMLHNTSTTPNPAHFNGTSATGTVAAKRAEEEAKGVDDIEKNNKAIDSFAQKQIDKRYTFWDKLANRGMYNEVQSVRKDLLTTSAQYRLSFYKTLLDARLEALHERCDSGVKMLKAMYRQQVGSYLMSQMEKMSIEVKQRQITFLNMMKEKYAYADTLNAFPSMRQKYMASVWEEEGRYLKFLDGLLQRYESIVGEQLQRHN